MAWQCGNCGQQTARGSVTFDEKGRRVRERCQHCAPEEFDSAFRMPSDNKVVAGHEAMPNLYKRGKDDVFRAKDELIADTADAWDKGPTARAAAHKAATRRTDPLTPEEIEKTKRWGDEVLAPLIREGGVAAVAGALNKE